MSAGWITKPLGEIARVGAGNSAPQDKALFAGGTHPFFRTSDVGRIHIGTIFDAEDHLNEKGIKRLAHYPAGTILVPKSGASTFLDHRVMLGVDGYVSSHLATVQANSSVVDTKYLFYFLLTVEARSLGVDTAYPTLSLAQVNAIKVAFPVLSEQQRIVAILDEVFEGLATATANAENNLKSARELFESYLDKVMTPTDSWSASTLESLVSKTQIGLVKNLKEQGEDKPYPYVKMHNITTENQFDGSVVARVCATKKEIEAFSLKRNDFLFNTRNSRELVGKCCLYEEDDNGQTLFNNNIMRMQFNGMLDARFCAFAFCTGAMKRQLEAVKSGATNVSAIYWNKLKDVVIRYPDINLQKGVVAEVQLLSLEAEKLRDHYEHKITKCAELKRSILHKALSGELTSPSQAIKEAAE